jgi:hypothetical protein
MGKRHTFFQHKGASHLEMLNDYRQSQADKKPISSRTSSMNLSVPVNSNNYGMTTVFTLLLIGSAFVPLVQAQTKPTYNPSSGPGIQHTNGDSTYGYSYNPNSDVHTARYQRGDSSSNYYVQGSGRVGEQPTVEAGFTWTVGQPNRRS